MHQLSIPQSVVDRVIAKRGREYVYEELDPAKTALVVVDMQNAFMLGRGARALPDGGKDRAQYQPARRRGARHRRHGGLDQDHVQGGRAQELVDLFRDGDAREGAKRVAALTADSKGHELWAALDVRPDDLIVEKNRFSAFIQGSSNLAEVLRARGLDTLLITGTVTNVCCELTARDAMMLNFRTIMVTDGNAAVTDEDHNASLARSI